MSGRQGSRSAEEVGCVGGSGRTGVSLYPTIWSVTQHWNADLTKPFAKLKRQLKPFQNMRQKPLAKPFLISEG